jgi:tetratricopeptide (TPR) repeat protein
MDAVTYPNLDVIQFIQGHVVPVRLPFDAKPEADTFNVKWTPTLIMLDHDGGEHHRTTGFLAPEELLPMILLGIGKTHFEREEFTEAITSLDTLLKDYPKSDSAPEAIYYGAVSRYKSTHKAQPLKEAYEKLQAEYPSSEWTRRAAPYRLL